jgi:hypothetical protein
VSEQPTRIMRPEPERVRWGDPMLIFVLALVLLNLIWAVLIAVVVLAA